MGLWSRLTGLDSYPFDTYDAAQRVLPDPYEPWIGTGGIPVADPGSPLSMLGRTQVETFWRTQPNVRKVVDFIARGIASIPFHAHERISDTDRQRLHNDPLSSVMSNPRPRVGAYRFWHGVLSDGLLYDRWAAIMQPRGDGPGLELVQVPSWRLRLNTDGLRRVTGAWYWVGEDDALASDRDGWRNLDLSMLVFDHGYAPQTAGLSPLETLRATLEETSEAIHYRRQVWNNGARVPAWIERPVEAPEWGAPARERFKTGFRGSYTGDGENAGGVPLLEDGMKLHSLDAFTPQDSMDLEGRRLSSIEVAAAFHIAPELVGARQGNYSNVREYRQMLYRDSFGPYIKALEDALNSQLVPELAAGRNVYVEANVESKLRGSFEEQASMMSSAIGAPWLLRNEGRALMNRPPIDGGDELVVPLNVLVGGQASPRDTGSQNRTSRTVLPVKSHVKAVVPEPYVDRAKAVFADFFARQGMTVQSRIGGGESWWDQARWDTELSDDLHRLAVLVSTFVGEKTLEEVGFDPSRYDTDRTLAFLRSVSDRVASQVNEATFDQITAALEDDEPDAAVSRVFEVAETSRAETSGLTAATTFAGFAAVEAGRQNSSSSTKTWVVNSANPRPSHAAMNGETVPVSENFSNGLAWPGDAGGGADEVAGCRCSLVIDFGGTS